MTGLDSCHKKMCSHLEWLLGPEMFQNSLTFFFILSCFLLPLTRPLPNTHISTSSFKYIFTHLTGQKEQNPTKGSFLKFPSHISHTETPTSWAWVTAKEQSFLWQWPFQFLFLPFRFHHLDHFRNLQQHFMKKLNLPSEIRQWCLLLFLFSIILEKFEGFRGKGILRVTPGSDLKEPLCAQGPHLVGLGDQICFQNSNQSCNFSHMLSKCLHLYTIFPTPIMEF